MNVFIPFIIFMTISYTICVCHYNSTIRFNKRRIKEIDVLRQIINQETIIRLAVVKDVKAVVNDVRSVKRRVASSETRTTMLQQALETLKRHVASLSQDGTLAQKMETLKRQIETLSQNNTLQQTVETLKRKVATLSQDDTLAQKIETLERQIETLSQNNTLHQTVETLKREIEFIKRDKTLQNTVESLKREVKTQRQEDRKISEKCQNRFQENDKKFKILNEKITNMYQHLKRTEVQTLGKDCKELYLHRQTKSGVYPISPFGQSQINVYCDMVTKGGGWTAIQRRRSGSVSFNRTWTEYKKGFGNPKDSYWIGNDAIHQLTKGRKSSLYVSITLRNGKTLYELYHQFSVSHETYKYKLFLGGPVTGTLGDRILNINAGDVLSGMYFTTPDKDNDKWHKNCAVAWGGGGWWFNQCSWAFLNGPWYPGNWKYPWQPKISNNKEIKETLMMIRPH